MSAQHRNLISHGQWVLRLPLVAGMVTVGCGNVAVVPDAAIDAVPLGIDAFKCPGGHDEDGDGFGDVCDNCPTIPNSDQLNVGEINANKTADTLGDACDPRPAESGDRIALVEYFNNGIPNGFFGNLNVVRTADALRFGSATTDAYLEFDAGVSDFTRTEFAFRVNAASPTAEQWVGLNVFVQTPGQFTPAIFGSGTWGAGQPLTFYFRERAAPPAEPRASNERRFEPNHDQPYLADEQYRVLIDTKAVTTFDTLRITAKQLKATAIAATVSELQAPKVPATSNMTLSTNFVEADYQYVIVYGK
jgi:Thrombospondin type 3 repeat